MTQQYEKFISKDEQILKNKKPLKNKFWFYLSLVSFFTLIYIWLMSCANWFSKHEYFKDGSIYLKNNVDIPFWVYDIDVSTRASQAGTLYTLAVFTLAIIGILLVATTIYAFLKPKSRQLTLLMFTIFSFLTFIIYPIILTQTIIHGYNVVDTLHVAHVHILFAMLIIPAKIIKYPIIVIGIILWFVLRLNEKNTPDSQKEEINKERRHQDILTHIKYYGRD